MKVIIYFITLLLLFTGCSAPQINFNDKIKAFELTRDNEILFTEDAKKVFESRVSLPYINVYQYIYKLDNREFVIYEQAYTDPLYVFNKSIDVLVNIIFPDYYSKRSATFGSLYFYTLQSQINKEIIYLLVENQNKKLLKIIYTKDKRMLEMLMHTLDENSQFTNLNIGTYKKDKKCHPFIKSKWNYKNILFADLVKRYGNTRRSVK